MIVEVRVATLFAMWQQRCSQVVVSMALHCEGLKTASCSSFEAGLADLGIDWEASRRDGLVRAKIVLRRRQ
jgi:hypothetical protein